MGDYWLGFLTPPLLAVATTAAFVAFCRAEKWLNDRGWTVEIKTDRKPENISNYRLRHDIWFELQRGPIFIGHWFREERPYDGTTFAATRWLGIGNSSGRSVIVYRKRESTNAD